ncbi:MAG: hypothetical protein JRH20_06455 [Deltaproteobacteria bacterium]|nr:hypothetical protein [Deltaproteobacteria bacterium]
MVERMRSLGTLLTSVLVLGFVTTSVAKHGEASANADRASVKPMRSPIGDRLHFDRLSHLLGPKVLSLPQYTKLLDLGYTEREILRTAHYEPHLLGVFSRAKLPFVEVYRGVGVFPKKRRLDAKANRYFSPSYSVAAKYAKPCSPKDGLLFSMRVPRDLHRPGSNRHFMSSEFTFEIDDMRAIIDQVHLLHYQGKKTLQSVHRILAEDMLGPHGLKNSQPRNCLDFQMLNVDLDLLAINAKSDKAGPIFKAIEDARINGTPLFDAKRFNIGMAWDVRSRKEYTGKPLKVLTKDGQMIEGTLQPFRSDMFFEVKTAKGEVKSIQAPAFETIWYMK